MMSTATTTNSKEAILAAGRQSAQAHGYGGLNFRNPADEFGVWVGSIYHHFSRKAYLGEAMARRYLGEDKRQPRRFAIGRNRSTERLTSMPRNSSAIA